MNRKRRKLVADFGGTHLRIGFSYEKKIENLSKIRYEKKLSSLELILEILKKFVFSNFAMSFAYFHNLLGFSQNFSKVRENTATTRNFSISI